MKQPQDSDSDTRCSPLTHTDGAQCDVVSANAQCEDVSASDLPDLDFTSECESECDACVSVSDDSASDLPDLDCSSESESESECNACVSVPLGPSASSPFPISTAPTHADKPNRVVTRPGPGPARRGRPRGKFSEINNPSTLKHRRKDFKRKLVEEDGFDPHVAKQVVDAATRATPAGASRGRPGRPRLELGWSELADRTRKRRIAELKRKIAELGQEPLTQHVNDAVRKLKDPEPEKKSGQPNASAAHRQRAPKNPSYETLVKVLLGRHESFDTWSAITSLKRGYGVYRSASVDFERDLLQGLEVGVSSAPRGAFLDPAIALPEFLHLAESHEVHWRGEYPRSLLLFQDANKMYGDRDSQLLSFSLPCARSPHQLALQLTIGRWLAKDSSFMLANIYRRINLVEALRAVLVRGVDGQPLRLVWAPDWKALRVGLNWCGPGAEASCPFCWCAKKTWKVAGTRWGPTRKLHEFKTPLAGFLSLFASEEDIIYDPLHCCSLVISHCVFQALYIWCENVGKDARLTQQVVALFKSLKLAKPWFAPAHEAIGRKDWTVGNNDTKAILFDKPEFWERLGRLFPTTSTGLQFSKPLDFLNEKERNAPFQTYFRLVRFLCQDLLSWAPKGVDTRDKDCEKMHLLFEGLGLSPRRWPVAAHVFCRHYTTRIRRHGNLQGLCSEGGEHLHQPHSRLVERRPSLPSWKCPVGLEAIVRWGARALRLWKIGVLVPKLFQSHKPTLPPKC
mmetsp:Transcript_138587/g.240964  ORF Transcript_138587/g.240964 Transcript_138587/m.240964 type:complete len:738 (-) Transcript_138587:73-2286(-)